MLLLDTASFSLDAAVRGASSPRLWRLNPGRRWSVCLSGFRSIDRVVSGVLSDRTSGRLVIET